ncbi:transient-receptor-potential-like protein [Macrosteles quadrilineatus]|uniref:transient-receptor-potential-like protein n=1 Tax=Macrosteles quadrilineatus TaxID=74068 RepID=UPI0023E16888|nr:transient-receptor-potential-like protein [Macrosteles quadrilineatus]
MANEKKDLDGVGVQIEGPGMSGSFKRTVEMPQLPKSLSLEEKKYLLAVERGDAANVRRMLQRAHHRHHIDINCADSLGRSALILAIEGENLEMVELLVVLGVDTKDALLHAINSEFVEAVELLLEHEEIVHKEGNPYSWEKVDWNTATFTPDITPLILAAHKNNYEIIKILLDRGATLPMPHDVRCGCEKCIRESEEDPLRFSLSRVNEYRALASPSLIALSSNDPILTAFQLSWELRSLAFAEQECKLQYMELRRQVQQFAVDLLHQSRSSQELAVILNHDPESPPYEDGDHMKLARLELAINYKQKKFVAHPNIQQLLAALWYDGLPGFRRMPLVKKLYEICQVALLFPFYCTLYMIAPNTEKGKLMRKPFMKFLIHASSYLFFLLILILVSQRAEVLVIQILGTDAMKQQLQEELMRQRGNGPSLLEGIVFVYVLGFIWEETMEIYLEGIQEYLRNMWNFIDFSRNSLYVAVFMLRAAAYYQQSIEISEDPATAYIPREQWDAFDPQLIAEGLFAAANVLSALKLVHMFSINPHLGPLQISLGRMVIDIVKFFFIYSLVLFAFACGLNQLLWYFAELERRKCYSLPGEMADWDNHGDSCTKWRSFGNVFEASQSLFWASFGMVGLDSFDLMGIKTYTRFWGLLMFGSYSVINVIVLLNLLIAMMSNSYALIEQHSDTEWKFARTKLWMSYFEESATLPPPFNIFPTPKMILKLLGIRKKDKLRRICSKKRAKQEKERDFRYNAVIRSLIWRYVSAMHRQADDSPVTDDDINEVKGEITAMRYELLEVLERNGMDVSSADKKKDTTLARKAKVWERRLMKDFHLTPVAGEDDLETLMNQPVPENEDVLARFRRVARLAVLSSTQQKWNQVVTSACAASQIGRCNNRMSLRNQQNLQKAMEEARKLVQKMPGSPRGHSPSPIHLPETTGSTIVELLNDIKEETKDLRTPTGTMGHGPGGGQIGKGSCGGMYLAVNQTSRNTSRNITPNNTIVPAEKQLSATKPESDKRDAKRDSSSERDPSPLICQRKLGVGEAPPKVFKKKPPPPIQDQEERKAEEPKKPAEQRAVPRHHCIDTDKLEPRAPGQVSFAQERQPSKSEIVRKPEGQKPREGPKPGDAIPRPQVKQSGEDVPKRPPGAVPSTSAGGKSAMAPQPMAKPSGHPGSSNNPGPLNLQGPSNAPGSASLQGSSHLQGSNTQGSSNVPSTSSQANFKPSQPSNAPQSKPPASSHPPTRHIIPKLELSLATNSTNDDSPTMPSTSSSTEQLITASPETLRPVNRIEDVSTIKREKKGNWL